MKHTLENILKQLFSKQIEARPKEVNQNEVPDLAARVNFYSYTIQQMNVTFK